MLKENYNLVYCPKSCTFAVGEQGRRSCQHPPSSNTVDTKNVSPYPSDTLHKQTITIMEQLKDYQPYTFAT